MNGKENTESLPTVPQGKINLRDVLGHYLLIEHAASWIAFGTFNRKTIEWSTHLSTIFDEQSDYFNTEFVKHDSQYWMAFQQLCKAIGRGKITTYGRYYEPEEGEEADPRADDVLADGRTRLVKPEEAHKLFAYLGGEEDNLAIGEHIYDLVAVNWHELIEVFGPLSLEFGSHLLKEKRPEPESFSFPEEPSPAISRRGRPQKWDWDQLNLEIVLLANSPKGLPQSQAELEAWAAEKCQDLFGAEPGISTIRSKIAPIYTRLRQKSQ